MDVVYQGITGIKGLPEVLLEKHGIRLQGRRRWCRRRLSLDGLSNRRKIESEF